MAVGATFVPQFQYDFASIVAPAIMQAARMRTEKEQFEKNYALALRDLASIERLRQAQTTHYYALADTSRKQVQLQEEAEKILNKYREELTKRVGLDNELLKSLFDTIVNSANVDLFTKQLDAWIRQQVAPFQVLGQRANALAGWLTLPYYVGQQKALTDQMQANAAVAVGTVGPRIGLMQEQYNAARFNTKQKELETIQEAMDLADQAFTFKDMLDYRHFLNNLTGLSPGLSSAMNDVLGIYAPNVYPSDKGKVKGWRPSFLFDKPNNQSGYNNGLGVRPFNEKMNSQMQEVEKTINRVKGMFSIK